MFLTILRSKPHLDHTAQSQAGTGGARGLKAIETESGNVMVHHKFEFTDYAGETPHAILSIQWSDVEILINQFANLGNAAALRLLRSDKLATAVEELTRNRD